MPDRDERYFRCFDEGKSAAASKLTLTSNPYVRVEGYDLEMLAWIEGYRSIADVKPSDVTFVRYDTPGQANAVDRSEDDVPSLVR